MPGNAVRGGRGRGRGSGRGPSAPATSRTMNTRSQTRLSQPPPLMNIPLQPSSSAPPGYGQRQAFPAPTYVPANAQNAPVARQVNSTYAQVTRNLAATRVNFGSNPRNQSAPTAQSLPNNHVNNQQVKDNAPTACGMCSALTDHNCIGCDHCELWFHPTSICMSLPPDVIETVKQYGGAGVAYICTDCRIAEVGNGANAKDSLTQLHQSVKALSSAMNGVVSNRSSNSDTSQPSPLEPAKLRSLIREETYEIAEREKRKSSLIVRGMDGNSPRFIPAFCSLATNLIGSFDFRVTSVQQVNPTMTRVTLNNSLARNALLDAAKHLCNSNYKDVFIQKDLTRVQRREQFDRRQERRRSNSHRRTQHQRAPENPSASVSLPHTTSHSAAPMPLQNNLAENMMDHRPISNSQSSLTDAPSSFYSSPPPTSHTAMTNPNLQSAFPVTLPDYQPCLPVSLPVTLPNYQPCLPVSLPYLQPVTQVSLANHQQHGSENYTFYQAVNPSIPIPVQTLALGTQQSFNADFNASQPFAPLLPPDMLSTTTNYAVRPAQSLPQQMETYNGNLTQSSMNSVQTCSQPSSTDYYYPPATGPGTGQGISNIYTNTAITTPLLDRNPIAAKNTNNTGAKPKRILTDTNRTPAHSSHMGPQKSGDSPSISSTPTVLTVSMPAFTPPVNTLTPNRRSPTHDHVITLESEPAVVCATETDIPATPLPTYTMRSAPNTPHLTMPHATSHVSSPLACSQDF